MIPPRPVQYCIGLTGNIATGKSTVASMLAELGAMVIDADHVAHQVMRQGTPVYDQIVATFGRDVMAVDGKIDRAHLGRIVFADPAALRQLEEIVHPAVKIEVDRRMATAESPVVVVEAIKLIESGMHRSCQTLWVTTCPVEQQIERLVQGRSLSVQEARQRVAAQPPQAEKLEVADVVINTAGSIEHTKRQVYAAWKAIGTARQAKERGGSYGNSRDVQSREG